MKSNHLCDVCSELLLRSIGLGNSYFPTRISESEVGVLTEFRVSHLEIRHFQLQWNDISYWETRIYEFSSPMERSKWPALHVTRDCWG